MNVSVNNYRHLKPVIMLFIALQLLLFAPRLNSDGAFYYEFVRSWVLQGDLNFHDEREFFTWEWIPVLDDFLPGNWEDTGYPPNIFSFGPAMIWMPLFVIGHWFVLLVNGLGAGMSSTGYGAVHRFLPMMASPLAGLATLFVMDRIGREAGFNPRDRAAALFFFLGASHLPAFLFVTPAFAHAYSVLFVSLFVLIWYYSARMDFTWKHSAIFGLVTGLAATARWQNLFCLILPFMDVLYGLYRNRAWSKKLAVRWSVFGLALFLAVVPQLLVTRMLYGAWVTDPQGDGGMQWFNPRFRLILFDGIKGLFTVNPVLLPATLALPFLWKRNRRLTWGLTLLVLSQSCINAVRRDWAGVGFGMRRFLNLSPAFAIGLMVIFALTSAHSRQWLRKTFWCAGIILIAWNLLLMGQYYFSRLGAPWVEMTTGDMIRAQLTAAPGHLAELIRTGLVVNGVSGDYVGLALGIMAIVIIAGVSRFLNAVDFPAGAYRFGSVFLTASCLYLLAVTGWLAHTASTAAMYLVPNICSPGYFASAEKLRLNPASGFQGFRGGIQFGPGQQKRVVCYQAGYDANRFLASGEIARTERDVPAGDTVHWTFNEPVEAGSMELISAVDHDIRPDRDMVIGRIIVKDIHDRMIELPILSGIHTGGSPVNPPVQGRLLERRWPALNPVEKKQWDTHTVFDFQTPILIRSIEIQFTSHSGIWFVRGLAFKAPDKSPVPTGNIR